MGAFWDERARENAAYFIENQLDYRDTDMDEFWRSGDRVVAKLLERVDAPPIRPQDVVVEVGCGIGRLTRPLAAQAARVHAIDVSAEMIARAKQVNPQLPNVDWVLGDGVSLQPVADASADVVFSHVVFQHIPDPAITLGYVREMGRVLRPGGWAAFQISNDPTIHRRWGGRLERRIRASLGRAPKGQDHPAWLGSAVDLVELRDVASASGLSVERVIGEGTQFCLIRVSRRSGAT